MEQAERAQRLRGGASHPSLSRQRHCYMAKPLQFRQSALRLSGADALTEEALIKQQRKRRSYHMVSLRCMQVDNLRILADVRRCVDVAASRYA